ncbi:MAG: tetratricopeptide repeat protein [Gammaproteobacteria bacterium]
MTDRTHAVMDSAIRLAERGRFAALRSLVDKLRAGDGVRRNAGRAFRLALKGAELGDAYLTWYVGDAYENGEGTVASLAEARRYYEHAMALGSPEAATALGVYWWTHARSSRDRKRALSLYRKAATQSEPHALHNLGVCYSTGNGVRRSFTTAYRYFLKAAKKGHLEAQFKVGWCLLYGEGVRTDPKKARTWLRTAARQGHREADKLLKSG